MTWQGQAECFPKLLPMKKKLSQSWLIIQNRSCDHRSKSGDYLTVKYCTLIVLFCLLVSCSRDSAATVVFTQNIAVPTLVQDEDPYLSERLDLVDKIKTLGVKDENVLRAMAAVPRHKFVPDEYLDQAYANHPLPIGYGQTISQPYIVAWMTELLELQPGDRVLEIGTGSGYQAAVLAELGDVEVYSIEIVPELAQSAAQRLQDLAFSNIHTKQGDGYYGWPEYAPYDAIIVTAAPDHLPAPLVNQLKKNGRLVIPLGPQGWVQTLWKFVQEEGGLKGYNLGGVSFVPLTGPGAEENAGAVTPTP
jgi:protein-L-isoaspartate(D-aspartate) O-methyltransferase